MAVSFRVTQSEALTIRYGRSVGNPRIGVLAAAARIRALAVAVAALSLAACGSSSDVVQIRQTVVRALHAIGSGDGAGFCSLVTQVGQAKLARTVPGSSCAQVVQLVGEHLSPAQRSGLQSVKVGRVTIKGDQASVTAAAITGSRGTLEGFLQKGSAATLLTKSGGTWKISG